MIFKLKDEIRTKKFIVVDDYESMRVMLGEDLKHLGVDNITFATSGNEAWSFIKKNLGTPNAFEIVITDFVMENGTGLELVKTIRATPELKTLPILMVTSESEATRVIECINAGISNYIVKPWKIDDLAKKITDSCTHKAK